MPILFAPLLGFVLGIALAWLSREELVRAAGPLLLARPVVIAAAFAAFVYAPATAYFVAFHPDWSYLYLVPRSRVPSAVDLALVLASGALVPLGVMVASTAARQRNVGKVVGLGSAPAVLAAGLFAWGARRLAVSATYAQFHGDYGTLPLSASSLGRGVLFIGIVLALGVAWTVRMLDPAAEGRRR